MTAEQRGRPEHAITVIAPVIQPLVKRTSGAGAAPAFQRSRANRGYMTADEPWTSRPIQ